MKNVETIIEKNFDYNNKINEVLLNLKIKDRLHWVGELDPELGVFDIVMQTQYGSSYNSYIYETKQGDYVLFETVKVKFLDNYLKKIKTIVDDFSKIKYIVVDHTEPDHIGCMEELVKYMPNATIIGSANALRYLKEITNNSELKTIVVKHNEEKEIGGEVFRFISVPMLHWPDSMFTYIVEQKALITCDVFGAHYSYKDLLISKMSEKEFKTTYKESLLYYFSCIFSPFKTFVLQMLKKIKDVPIDLILTGHGPILDDKERIAKIQKNYKNWSTDVNPYEHKLIVMPYCTAYGFTEMMAEEIIEGIKEADPTIKVKAYQVDVSNYHKQKQFIMNDMYFANGILFGSPTINNDALPVIWDLAISLSPLVHGQFRKIASVFGSYGWSGEAVDNITGRLKQLQMKVMPGLKINFKPSPDQKEIARQFGRDFGEAVKTGRLGGNKKSNPGKIATSTSKATATVAKGNTPSAVETESQINPQLIEWALKFNPKKEVLKWRCLACDEVFDGIYPPEICTVCGASYEMFEVFQEEKVKFHLDRKVKITIIGAGAAGIAAAEAARIRNKDAEITIISNESYTPYYRPAVSALILEDVYKRIPKAVFLKEQKWYQNNNINLMLGCQISNIDYNSRYIFLEQNQEEKKLVYDKLIIATGASPFVPPIKGLEHKFKNVFTCNTIDDVKEIKSYLESHKVKDVIVCGGGVLGLENAWSMKRMNMNVKVVEIADYLLPMQLDEETSQRFTELLKQQDIEFVTGCGASEIRGENQEANEILLSNKETFPCDLVILSCGVKANLDFINREQIRVNRGILIDEQMQTSVPNVYACGDCSELENQPAKMLWAPAISQGQVAGSVAVGENAKYKFCDYPMTIMICENKLVAVGDVKKYQEQRKELEIIQKNICEDNFTKIAFNRKSGVVWGISVNNNQMQLLALAAAKDDNITYAAVKKQAL